jgi:uncharacterized membrane protein YoaK (UPF0700 family)
MKVSDKILVFLCAAVGGALTMAWFEHDRLWLLIAAIVLMYISLELYPDGKE